MKQYRQGDVLIVKTDSKPSARHKRVARDERDRVVLAHGELTGHAHAISEKGATLYQRTVRGEVNRMLRLSRSVKLEHEEHDTIELPAGTYEVRQQREFEPGSRRHRNVAD